MTKTPSDKPTRSAGRKVDARLKAAFEALERAPASARLTDHLNGLTGAPPKDRRS